MASKSKVDLKAAYEAAKKKNTLDEIKISSGIRLSEEIGEPVKAEPEVKEEVSVKATPKTTPKKTVQKAEVKEQPQEKKLGRPYADKRSSGKTTKITVEITEQEQKAIRDYCYQNNVGKLTVIRDALDSFFEAKGYYK